MRRHRGSDRGDDLDRWVAELRADEAGSERSRRRMLARASTEESTVGAVITDLAEREEPVVIEVEGDRLVRGIVRLVGTDAVVLRDDRTETVVRLDAVTSIRLRPDQPGRWRSSPRSGSASAPRSAARRDVVDLVRILAALAETEPMVTVHRRGVRSPLGGTLVAVGADVAVVQAPPAGTTYVPLWSVVVVSLTGSG